MKPIAYRNYLLTVLACVLSFNSMDRLALGLLLQDIKADLALSDMQLGLLSGIAFALFYSIMGIPIARWADRGNRVTIVTATTGLWCAAVSLCGAAGNFVQLLLIRIGVAVGEAGCIPCANSLIADYFTRAERPRATSRYMLGGALSVVIGYFVAGWINERYGWRVTFVIIGLPGVMLAVLAGLTLKEPRRAQAAAAPPVPANEPVPARAPQPSLKEVAGILWVNTTFRHLLFAFAVTSFFNYGVAKWLPAFFIRSHGLNTGELGTWLALIYGVSGVVGVYWGGELASRYAAGNERRQLRGMGVLYSGFAMLSVFTYLTSSHYVAFATMAVAAIGINMTLGPMLGTIQTLVPDRIRAVSLAVVYLFANLIGMGLGPLATGALSDAFRPWAGEESLRYALLTLCPGYFLGAWHFWHASKTVARDLPAQPEVKT